MNSLETVTDGVAQNQQGDYTLLFSRLEDGNFPVKVFSPPQSRRRYEVIKPTGEAVYSSTRQFLAGERGTTRAHWTHARYFKLGKWNPDPILTSGDHLTVLDLFAPTAQDTSLTLARISLSVPMFTADEAIATTETPLGPCKNPPLAVSSTACGVDLESRSTEVAKLFFKAYGAWIRKARFEDDDVLQEIFKGVLVRNIGKCPWDPARSTFGNYVTMVARGVVFNYYRRETRRRRRETIGYTHLEEGYLTDVDVAEHRSLRASDALWASNPEWDLERPVLRLALYLRDHARLRDRGILTILAVLLDLGFTRREISSKLGLSSGEYTATHEKLRSHTAAWAHAGCL